MPIRHSHSNLRVASQCREAAFLSKPQGGVNRSSEVPVVSRSRRLLPLGTQRGARSGSSLATMTTLVSFDIDGTLVRSCGEKANHLHKEAFSHCFKAIFGVDTHIDTIKHHGGTDPLIIKKVLQHSGISGEDAMERMTDLQDAMCAYYQENSAQAGEGIEVLGGVVELLKALQLRGDVVTCLVTGNLEPIGWTKMQACGIRHLFSTPNFGGFGSDFCSGNTAEMWHDRAEFIRISAKKASELNQGGIKAHFHIGDTPMDLYAAAAAGVGGIGVATGIYSREELEDANTGAIVVDNLSDVGSMLDAMGLADGSGAI